MGDRANIFIKQDVTNEGIWLYSHWGGRDLAATLQRAIKKMWRWEDEHYLARIIFDEMIGENQGDELSFGISTRMCDNEYPILCVDCQAQTVTARNRGPGESYGDRAHGESTEDPNPCGDIINAVSFDKFITLSEDEIIAFRGETN